MARKAADLSDIDEAAEQYLTNEVAAFFDDFLGFIRWNFPWGEPGPLKDEDGPDVWQVDFAEKLDQALKDGADLKTAIRIAVASGHGVGKTTTIAWLIIWFMATHENPQIVVTASTLNQLSGKTWRELAKWHRLSKVKHWFTWTATKYARVSAPDTWFAVAIPWSDTNADAFAGTHEKYVLVIYDEGNAVGDKIWETTEGALTTTNGVVLWIVFGNYTRTNGRFHECFAGRMRDRWIRIQVDSRTAKKANQAQLKQWVEDYGEDSDFVRIRVRGVAPRQGSNQFISQDVMDVCKRYKARGYDIMPKVLTLEVARFGENQSVAGCRQGRHFQILKKWRGMRTDHLAEEFCELIEKEEPDAIIMDGDGDGGAVVDMIKRKNFDRRNGKTILFEVNRVGPAINPVMYANRLTEIWGTARDALKDGAELSDDIELQADMIAPEYTYAVIAGHNVMRIESSEDMIGRGATPPDCAQAFVLSYAVKMRPGLRQVQYKPSPITAGSHNTAWLGT